MTKSKFSGKTSVLPFVRSEKHAMKIRKDKTAQHKEVIAKTELMLK